jgi:hypothetical protein
VSRQDRHTIATLGVPVLRVDRRGDRHLIRDLVVDVRVELPAPHEGAEQALVRAVHALAATHGDGDAESYALAVARYCLRNVAGALRAGVEVRSRGWGRLDIGGRPRGRDFIGPSSELRIAVARVAAARELVSAGLRRMLLLTSAEHAAGGVTVQRLDALWSYGWAEVPFETQWQQVRRGLTEAYAERGDLEHGALAAALARAVLDESPPVHRIAVRLGVIHRGVVDVTAYGMENTGTVFGAAEAARTVHEAVLVREELAV